LLEGPLPHQIIIFSPGWVATLLEKFDMMVNNVFQYEIPAVNEPSLLLFAEGTFPIVALSECTKG